jgi:hypothetical protein
MAFRKAICIKMGLTPVFTLRVCNGLKMGCSEPDRITFKQKLFKSKIQLNRPSPSYVYIIRVDVTRAFFKGPPRKAGEYNGPYYITLLCKIAPQNLTAY